MSRLLLREIDRNGQVGEAQRIDRIYGGPLVAACGKFQNGDPSSVADSLYIANWMKLAVIHEQQSVSRVERRVVVCVRLADWPRRVRPIDG